MLAKIIDKHGQVSMNTPLPPPPQNPK